MLFSSQNFTEIERFIHDIPLADIPNIMTSRGSLCRYTSCLEFYANIYSQSDTTEHMKICSLIVFQQLTKCLFFIPHFGYFISKFIDAKYFLLHKNDHMKLPYLMRDNILFNKVIWLKWHTDLASSNDREKLKCVVWKISKKYLFVIFIAFERKMLRDCCAGSCCDLKVVQEKIK